MGRHTTLDVEARPSNPGITKALIAALAGRIESQLAMPHRRLRYGKSPSDSGIVICSYHAMPKEGIYMKSDSWPGSFCAICLPVLLRSK